MRRLAPLLLALFIAHASLAQARLEQLPGYDRVGLVRENMGQLVTGGRVEDIRWSNDGTSVSFRRDEKWHRFDLATKELSEATEPPAESQPESRPAPRRAGRGRQLDSETSPDGKWIAKSINWNVIIESPDGSEKIEVTTAGSQKLRYGKASWVYGEELDQTTAMWWSPDSTKLVFYEFDERPVKDFYLLSGWTELRTEVEAEGYPKAGEPNPIARLLVYDVEKQSTLPIDTDDAFLFPGLEHQEQYIYNVRFAPQSSDRQPRLLFNRTNRRQNVLEVRAADVSIGVSRVVLTEKQSTWQNNSPQIDFLKDGHRFIWETEKSSFKQFELRDVDFGLIHPLTRGKYPVERLLRIDEDAETMYYTAYSGDHPLNLQLHRVRLDGTKQTRMTPAAQHHSDFDISPDGKWFIATAESVDQPPTTYLYNADGERAATLAESESSKFNELGMTMPELFAFQVDEITELYGVLYKPSNFDSSKKYPLVIDVYGGPQSRAVRNRFRAAEPYCELGFLIAEIDNRGTTGRGKAFESAVYLKLGDVDLKDQVNGVRHLVRRPYVDGEHVGIFGSSYGGYMAALAILKYPEVFHVAVAGSAVTDWRHYDTIYTERYMWTPQENAAGYDAGSCMKFAENLTGKLLIMHGMRDDNVHPNNAWQLIDALNKAGKRFDMLWYPNGGHGTGRAGAVRQWEFLYEHLIAHPHQPSAETAPSDDDELN